jgi:hypothetical protein
MAFALFYNLQDLTPLAAQFNRTDLSTADKNYCKALWQNGGSGWSTAPIAPEPYAGGDPDCRVLVIAGTYQGQPLTLAQLVTFLWRMAASPGWEFMGSLAADISTGAGGKDPYP